jgi:hypothetical protein
MSKRLKLAFALAAAAGAAGAALLTTACESVPLTAAPGTDMKLIANPEFEIANGGVSVVTAILVEPAGTFVPDGTEIFCFTNLGRVDRSGKTVDGVARVNFVSDARSGTATVTCTSGGPAPAPAPSPTPTPAGTVGGVTASATTTPRVVAATDVAAAENSATVEIAVGNALPDRVIVTANPQVLSNARSSTIVANVLDANGNPVQNVPVSFSLDSAATAERLETGGALQYTNSNGQVFDTLRTQAPFGLAQATVTVTATTANGIAGTVRVFID